VHGRTGLQDLDRASYKWHHQFCKFIGPQENRVNPVNTCVRFALCRKNLTTNSCQFT
jgi:hypothetical protein